METVNTSVRLDVLRQLMRERNLDLYVVPSEDSHKSEYIASCDCRREYISGFSGSAGTAVVTLDKAALGTDGRYFNQAEKQLDDNWELLKQGLPDVPTWKEWITKHAHGAKTVGVDPTLISSEDARKLEEKLKEGNGKLEPVEENLIDIVWGQSRPSRPNEKVFALNFQFSGKTFQDKLEDLRSKLIEKNGAGFVISMLDEVAWLFNLRGSDIPYNPVFFSYAVVTSEVVTLYVDRTKLDAKIEQHLGDKVTIKPYESIFNDIKLLSAEAPNQKFLLSKKGSWALSRSLGGKEKVEEVSSPIANAKSVKNKVELDGMRACHIRDGAALIQYFAWLENQLIVNGAKIDEVEAADKLESLRSVHKNFVGLSFDTISSTGPNAAVIHYKPERGSCSVIDPCSVYLCDSGAQFLDGTTDVTRTLHFGDPTDMERKAYTLVLKGNIALENIIFPKGTTGFALDTLARQFLWAEGLDYRHGTGHGVGSFLNVHEGPIGIGTYIHYSKSPLAVGNVISNEPGYYEDENFGIRIENLMMVKEIETKHRFGNNSYFGFEHVTMVPMCRKLIDSTLLTPMEKSWLNNYHAEVLKKTREYVKSDSIAMAWLERETNPY